MTHTSSVGAGLVSFLSSYKALLSSSPLRMLTLASALRLPSGWPLSSFGRDPPTLDAVPSRRVNSTGEIPRPVRLSPQHTLSQCEWLA